MHGLLLFPCTCHVWCSLCSVRVEFYPDYELDIRNAAAAPHASRTAAALLSTDDAAWQVSTQQAAADLASAVLSDTLTTQDNQAGAQAKLLHTASSRWMPLHGPRSQWQDVVQMAQLAVTLDRQKGLLLHRNPALVSLLRDIEPDLAAEAADRAQQGGLDATLRVASPWGWLVLE